MKKKELLIIIFIFLLACIVRFLSVWPDNAIIGFDQARDIFDSMGILKGDLRIIGPTAGNNPNLHHGIAWLYFMTVPLILSNNPIYIVLWNLLFNAFSSVVVYLLAKDLFKSERVGIIAGILTAVSYYFVSFSGWLSNPTLTLLTVPLFFFGFWKYYQNKNLGLILSLLALGLSIQLELFFLYLIPVFTLLWIILKPKIPTPKTLLISVGVFLLSILTMIATEIKFKFAGILNILRAGKLVGETHEGFFPLLKDFVLNKYEVFYLNFWPQNKNFGLIFGCVVVLFFVFEIVKNKKNKEIVKRNLFLLVWLFSPVIMLVLGSHNAPWFLIGRQAAGVIMGAYLITKLRTKLLVVPLVLFFVYSNLTAIKTEYGQGQKLLEPDNAAILSKQVEVMKYTYGKSQGDAFAIDTVTNPLYINAVWALNYEWYGKKEGYKPSWLGGDQLAPYNTLIKATGNEKYLFVIIDQTSRIPDIYRENAIKNISKMGKLVEEKNFAGITVMTFVNQ